MYAQDSFFTLSLLGQIGLFGLSVILFLVMVWAALRLPGHWAVRLLLAFSGFYLFLWVSPQIYYLYYRTLFDDLPQQLVIGAPPSLLVPLQLLTFTQNQSLAAHSQAILGWAMILASQFPHVRRKCRDAAN